MRHALVSGSVGRSCWALLLGVLLRTSTRFLPVVVCDYCRFSA